ncbi:hypothetical protein [Streptomyces sp. NPDC003863]
MRPRREKKRRPPFPLPQGLVLLPTPDARRPTPDVRRPTADGRRPTSDVRRPTADARRPTPDGRRHSLIDVQGGMACRALPDVPGAADPREARAAAARMVREPAPAPSGHVGVVFFTQLDHG